MHRLVPPLAIVEQLLDFGMAMGNADLGHDQLACLGQQRIQFFGIDAYGFDAKIF